MLFLLAKNAFKNDDAIVMKLVPIPVKLKIFYVLE